MYTAYLLTYIASVFKKKHRLHNFTIEFPQGRSFLNLRNNTLAQKWIENLVQLLGFASQIGGQITSGNWLSALSEVVEDTRS